MPPVHELSGRVASTLPSVGASASAHARPSAAVPLQMALSAMRARTSAGTSSEKSKSASIICDEVESAVRIGAFALARCRRFWNHT
eukprot:4486194-Pleurochrysis_carterae.AAC.1